MRAVEVAADVVAIDVGPALRETGAMGVVLVRDRTDEGSVFYRVAVVYRLTDRTPLDVARVESFSMTAQARRRYDALRRSHHDMLDVVRGHMLAAESA